MNLNSSTYFSQSLMRDSQYSTHSKIGVKAPPELDQTLKTNFDNLNSIFDKQIFNQTVSSSVFAKRQIENYSQTSQSRGIANQVPFQSTQSQNQFKDKSLQRLDTTYTEYLNQHSIPLTSNQANQSQKDNQSRSNLFNLTEMKTPTPDKSGQTQPMMARPMSVGIASPSLKRGIFRIKHQQIEEGIGGHYGEIQKIRIANANQHQNVINMIYRCIQMEPKEVLELRNICKDTEKVDKMVKNLGIFRNGKKGDEIMKKNMNFSAVYSKMMKDNEDDNQQKIQRNIQRQQVVEKNQQFDLRVNHWAVPKQKEDEEPFFQINFHSVNDYMVLHSDDKEKDLIQLYTRASRRILHDYKEAQQYTDIEDKIELHADPFYENQYLKSVMERTLSIYIANERVEKGEVVDDDEAAYFFPHNNKKVDEKVVEEIQPPQWLNQRMKSICIQDPEYDQDDRISQVLEKRGKSSFKEGNHSQQSFSGYSNSKRGSVPSSPTQNNYKIANL